MIENYLPLLILSAALLIDHLFGEPSRWHPLVGFGRYATLIEKHCNATEKQHGPGRQLWGVIALVAATAPFIFLFLWLRAGIPQAWLLDVVVLYYCIGLSSLKTHVMDVYQSLETNSLDSARSKISRIVSRDTKQLAPTGICRAAIESLLENGSDALFAVIFWYLVAGPEGALLYRLSNTLDAMWGYKTPRYHQFGWAAARWDDLLNWLPARLTATSYALVGNWSDAIHCWRHQASQLHSPNAGPVMTSGAGALGVILGGDTFYHGEKSTKIEFGCGHQPQASDITTAIRLITRTVWLWLIALFLILC